MDIHGVERQKGVESRYRRGQQRQAVVARQATRGQRHCRNGGDPAGERQDLERPLGVGKDGGQPPPDDEEPWCSVDRGNDHAPEVGTSNQGAVDDVVSPQRFGIPPGKTRENRAEDDGRAGQHRCQAQHLPAGVPEPSRQEDDCRDHRQRPDQDDDRPEPGRVLRQADVGLRRGLVEQPVPRERSRWTARARPAEAQRVGATVLLVVDPDRMDARVHNERTHLGVHVRRRSTADDQHAVEPHVEAVVAGSVQLQLTGLGNVPETTPAGAEESLRYEWHRVEKLERDPRTQIPDDRRPAVPVLRIHLAEQAGAFRRARTEDEQKHGQGDGHRAVTADNAPQGASRQEPSQVMEVESRRHEPCHRRLPVLPSQAMKR